MFTVKNRCSQLQGRLDGHPEKVVRLGQLLLVYRVTLNHDKLLKRREAHTAQYSPFWVGKLYTFLAIAGGWPSRPMPLLVVTCHLSLVRRLRVCWLTRHTRGDMIGFCPTYSCSGVFSS